VPDLPILLWVIRAKGLNRVSARNHAEVGGMVWKVEIVAEFETKGEKRAEYEIEEVEDRDPEFVGHVVYESRNTEQFNTVEELKVVAYSKLGREETEEKAREFVEKIRERYDSGSVAFDGVGAFNSTLELLTSLWLPYSTRGIKVEKFRDTGGDYPDIELEYYYLA